VVETTSRTGNARARSGIKRILTTIFVVAVLLLAGYLLYRTWSRYSLAELGASLAAIPAYRLLLAALFAALSYLCLTGFDWLATRYVGHPLPYRYVALTSFTSLSLGHNIGFAALSSGAIRYRFYSQRGLHLDEIAKIILFCATTVGLGLLLLGGGALVLRSSLAAELTGLDQSVILAIGTLCLLLAATYLLLAALVRRPLRFRRWTAEMPPLRLALAQAVIGPLNFACVAACLHQALSAAADLPYLTVAAVYVIANVTALMAHVPGGLGVIESVVQYLLPQGLLAGPLVAFRVTYFLLPLCIGAPLFALAELRRRSSRQRADTATSR
jgi:glycosyltransferase 2 family protein